MQRIRSGTSATTFALSVQSSGLPARTIIEGIGGGRRGLRLRGAFSRGLDPLPTDDGRHADHERRGRRRRCPAAPPADR